MRVLAVASEMYPLVKTGGLADVAGALPPALGKLGIEVRTLLPGYPSVMSRLGDMRPVHEQLWILGEPARLLKARVEGREILVFDAPTLFDRPGGPYSDPHGHDYPDNWRRFAALSRLGAEIAGGLLPEFRPDLVHVHDWQTALTPAYMRFRGIALPSVVTIHNMAFQGQYAADIFGGLDLPGNALAIDGVEYYGGVGFLKAGLLSATAITTVSETYAREIGTPGYGMGLEGLIAGRADALHGIVNGIDTEAWDPETDPHLAERFSAERLDGRVANRRALESRFGLDADAAPLFCVVSRLTWQKGMDLLAASVDDLVAAGAKLVVLGTGDAALEGALLSASAHHRGRVGAMIGYDEALAHMIQGGADAILIPSRFEPCGLTQLYGLRYGCVPIVSRVGGLADTIIDANPAAVNAGVATGIQFAPVDVPPLGAAIRRATALYDTPGAWAAMQRRGMASDLSWDRSAAQYAALYRTLAPGV